MKPVVKGFLFASFFNIVFVVPHLVSTIVSMCKGIVPRQAGVYGVILYILLMALVFVVESLAMQRAELKKKLEILSGKHADDKDKVVD